MTARPLFALLLVASVAACDSEPGVACTLIGCDDALVVTVADADGALAPGRYAVSASSNVADEVPSRCAFTVADDGEVESECGAFARADEPGAVDVQLPPLAGPLTIGVERGALVGRQAAEPVYRGQFPNGPDCGEVCRTATVRVTVP